MPKNPNKTPCQHPGCHNWAMRGHAHCRPHLDAELGPRGAGAPPGNLNALKTGHHAHPLNRDELRTLAAAIDGDPDQLPALLGRAIHSLHARTRDPGKTVLALQAALTELQPLIAQHRFTAELADLLRQIPPQHRAGLQAILWKGALPLGPEARLTFLRLMAGRLQENILPDGPPAPAIDSLDRPGDLPSPLEPFMPEPSSSALSCPDPDVEPR